MNTFSRGISFERKDNKKLSHNQNLLDVRLHYIRQTMKKRQTCVIKKYAKSNNERAGIRFRERIMIKFFTHLSIFICVILKREKENMK